MAAVPSGALPGAKELPGILPKAVAPSGAIPGVAELQDPPGGGGDPRGPVSVCGAPRVPFQGLWRTQGPRRCNVFSRSPPKGDGVPRSEGTFRGLIMGSGDSRSPLSGDSNPRGTPRSVGDPRVLQECWGGGDTKGPFREGRDPWDLLRGIGDPLGPPMCGGAPSNPYRGGGYPRSPPRVGLDPMGRPRVGSDSRGPHKDWPYRDSALGAFLVAAAIPGPSEGRRLPFGALPAEAATPGALPRASAVPGVEEPLRVLLEAAMPS
ncbi:basic salivary proline-rich protein 1-like [Homarus americanus]|uniref:basic salivary proline-rich protein 1-like n=1 Tax=Homarus americanus TaxID=6706 RepID=UPI001C456400|nr:basic salivary proline-rich protein 1-like [Homarus americanus]